MLENEPTYRSEKFKCPHCGVLAQQKWFSSHELSNTVFTLYSNIYLNYRVVIQNYQQQAIQDFLDEARKKFPSYMNSYIPKSLSIAICQYCNKYSLWINKDMVYPRKVSIEPPNKDLNEEIKSIYNEAAKIFIDSPRGAAALLRLALQLLLKQLGKKGKDINSDIKELVKDGLSPKIQKALDFVRVVGNNAVHPGQINFEDNKNIALTLFEIINIIANEMITKPKEIDELYEKIIPEKTKQHINNRDKKKSERIT